ncbi:MAG: alpha-amylase family glycosyl hydrolase [Bacteroidota bacterium]
MQIKIESTSGFISKISDSYKNEFHIASQIRNKFDIDESLFSLSGNVIFANFPQVRKFVASLNETKDDAHKVKVSEVNAAGLIDEIFHFVIRFYDEEINPGVVEKLKNHLEHSIGEEKLRQLLFDFVEKFPPLDVYQGKVTIFDYLNSYDGNRSNYLVTLEELLLLNFANINPANKNIIELFDDDYLSKKKVYANCLSEIKDFFKDEEPIGEKKQDLFTFLKTPIDQNPENIEAQLDFISDEWKIILKEKFSNRILSGKDLIKEEYFMGGPGGPAPTVVPKYKKHKDWLDSVSLGRSGFDYAEDSLDDYDEPEAFTSDIHWMPNVILMAKNAYVWLDQLSKKYQRPIKRLDQIPDEELDQLAISNINGLWLIGIWERSHASKRIKHIMGNIDAVASAYSLYDYIIAHDLGGEEAYHTLNEKAKQRGIRLASDMVPNHTGVFSDWMIYHPDYFIQVPDAPFPTYQFNGEDLSDDPNIEIKIDDGYYAKSDAAVVFRRIDKRYNDVRYIYHGNDGTVMPWNDTAQLDMLKHEVREAVIQKIFDVARRFSIIRFDAAMTLAKKHFSRLWYPRPGSGGDIASRADHAMSKEHFDELFPVEFWREVVDRINKEMPHTLLLAEAFWLMEGYFVRTLGMHRVYNSAFMHMLMNEENDKYRELIYNTLEFEPEILKRYVNFMSNPDEETAIQQFGTDDKYFGVLTMMVTLPGLPMFAHGQIEGYTEKYGMEYKRAYYDEEPKQWLEERHEREIFSLTRRRHLFSEVANFWFYDFYDEFGNLNDNVFVYTNSFNGEGSLVIYNNKFDRIYGNFQKSTPKLIKINENDKYLKEITVSESLGIKADFGTYYVAKDLITDLEYIFRGSDITQNGFYLELNGFEHKVFIDFRKVQDINGDYHQLCEELHGNGVYSVEGAIEDKKLSPIYDSFENIFNEHEIERCSKWLINKIDSREEEEYHPQYISDRFEEFLKSIKVHFELEFDTKKYQEQFIVQLQSLHSLNVKLNTEFLDGGKPQKDVLKFFVFSSKSSYRENLIIFIIWLVLSSLDEIFEKNEDLNYYIKERVHGKTVNKILDRLGRGESDEYKKNTLIKIISETENLLFDRKFELDKFLALKSQKDISAYISESKAEFITSLLDNDYVKLFLDINYYEDVWFYSKETYEELVEWLLSISLIKYVQSEPIKSSSVIELVRRLYSVNEYLLQSSDKSGFQLEKLEAILLHS